MKAILALVFALFLPLAHAQTPAPTADGSPEGLVRKVTTDVLEAVKSDAGLQAGDKQKALALAEQKVLPHLDFTEMTRLAAGRTWNTATADRRSAWSPDSGPCWCAPMPTRSTSIEARP